MVERRKIQKTGSSSYIVTLPKEWVDSVGLKPGDFITVHRYGNKLVLSPGQGELRGLSADIKVSDRAGIDEIFRMIISYYLAGYDTITVEFSGKMQNLAKKISELKNLARIKLAGVEVIDETYNTLVFKILLNINELPLMRAMRRLHLIVNNMLVDALESFKNKDYNLAETVIQRDDEADRFHFMIIRQLSLALLDISIMQELGIANPVETLNYRIIARNLERIADHAVNIAYCTFKRPDECIYCAKVYDMGKDIVELLSMSMNSFYKLSRRDAENVINKSQAILSSLGKMFSEEILLSNISDREKTTLTTIYDSLRRITRYCSGIAEATLNIKVSRAKSIEIG